MRILHRGILRQGLRYLVQCFRNMKWSRQVSESGACEFEVGWTGSSCEVCLAAPAEESVAESPSMSSIYGGVCKAGCMLNEIYNSRRRCRGDGICECEVNWEGDLCDVCVLGFSGEDC